MSDIICSKETNCFLRNDVIFIFFADHSKSRPLVCDFLVLGLVNILLTHANTKGFVLASFSEAHCAYMPLQWKTKCFFFAKKNAPISALQCGLSNEQEPQRKSKQCQNCSRSKAWLSGALVFASRNLNGPSLKLLILSFS